MRSPGDHGRSPAFHMHRGVLALGRRSPQLAGDLSPRRSGRDGAHLFASPSRQCRRHFRNAAAFGADAVVLDGASCDRSTARRSASRSAALDRTLRSIGSEEDPLPSSRAGFARSRSARTVASRSTRSAQPAGRTPPRRGGPAFPRKSWRARTIVFHGRNSTSLNVAPPAASSSISHVAAVMRSRQNDPDDVSAPSRSRWDAGGESQAIRRAPRSRRNTGSRPQQDEEVHRVEAAHSCRPSSSPRDAGFFDGDRCIWAVRRVRKRPHGRPRWRHLRLRGVAAREVELGSDVGASASAGSRSA